MSAEIKKAVVDSYSRIGCDYDRARKSPFKEVERFLSTGGVRVLDIGTGNGRNLSSACNAFSHLVGIDLCRKMLCLARANFSSSGLGIVSDLLVADAACLPFAKMVFDKCVSTAVLHHMPPKQSKEAVTEAVRVLKHGGELLCSVWDKREIESRATGRSGEWYIVPWGTVERLFFGHAPEELAETAGGFPVSSMFFSYPNLYIWVRKV